MLPQPIHQHSRRQRILSRHRLLRQLQSTTLPCRKRLRSQDLQSTSRHSPTRTCQLSPLPQRMINSSRLQHSRNTTRYGDRPFQLPIFFHPWPQLRQLVTMRRQQIPLHKEIEQSGLFVRERPGFPRTHRLLQHRTVALCQLIHRRRRDSTEQFQRRCNRFQRHLRLIARQHLSRTEISTLHCVC